MRPIRVRALVVTRDLGTDELRQPGEEFDLAREPGEVVKLMMGGIVEILDPQVNPGIVVSPDLIEEV